VRPLIALLLAAGCGAAASSTPTSSTLPTPGSPGSPDRDTGHRGITATEPFVPVDPAKALADPGATKATYLVPGTVRLDPTGLPVDAPPGAPPIEVGIADQQGSLVRVVVRLPTARFLVWSDRDRLFAIVRHDARVSDWMRAAGNLDTTEAILHYGGVQIEGWIPDDALAETLPTSDERSASWYGGQRLMLMPGAVIRSEAKWASRELALMAKTPFVETIKKVDDEWTEVRYADRDTLVHGYVSTRSPPGRLHHPAPPDPPPTPITPTDKAPEYTCLYASEQGDAIGFLTSEQEVELSPGNRLGWFKLAIDTPWGALTFAAQGATKRELMTCPPAFALAPSAPTTPPTPTPPPPTP